MKYLKMEEILEVLGIVAGVTYDPVTDTGPTGVELVPDALEIYRRCVEHAERSLEYVASNLQLLYPTVDTGRASYEPGFGGMCVSVGPDGAHPDEPPPQLIHAADPGGSWGEYDGEDFYETLGSDKLIGVQDS